MVEKTFEDKIREIVRDEIYKQQHFENERKRLNEPFVPYMPTVPPWPPRENRCHICGIDLNQATNYVCNFPTCPSKVQYLAEGNSNTSKE